MSTPHVTPVFVFADLDDTLFNSTRKCRPDVALEPAAALRDGSIISYTNPAQRRLLKWLSQDSMLVPVTARSTSGFSRVLVPFDGLAVIGFGAVILGPGGQADPSWTARMRAVLAPVQPLLAHACSTLTAAIAERGLDAWARVVEEFDLGQYVVVKHRGADADALAALRIDVLVPWAAARPGWRVFQNDNNLVLLPPGLDKSEAVARVLADLRARHGSILSIGIGDSASDAAFLNLCDYAMAPAGTQLASRLFETKPS